MTRLPESELGRFRRSRTWLLLLYTVALIGLGVAHTHPDLSGRVLAAAAIAAGVGALIELVSFFLLRRVGVVLYIGRFTALAALSSSLLPLWDPLWPLVVLPAAAIMLLTLSLGAVTGLFAAAVAAAALLGPDPLHPSAEILLTAGAYGSAILAALGFEYYFQNAAPEQQFSDLVGFEHVTEGIMVTNRSEQIYYLNPSASKLTQWSREEAAGLPITSILTLSAEGGKSLDVELHRALRSGTASTIRGILVSRSTPGRVLDVSISPMPEGRGALLLLQDVTDQVQRDKMKLEFASTVSHELRTPLAAVSGYLELVKGSKSIPAKEADQVQKAYDGVRHMSRLLQQFLRTVQIDHRQVQAVVVKPIDLGLLLDEVVGEFQAEAVGKGLRLERAPQSGIERPLPAPLADADRLREVLENLVGNALKFTEHGGVTLGAALADGQVIVTVQDTGIGIKAEDLPRLFEQYYRSETQLTQTRGGTGLGLYISKSLVESMGGTISISSKFGQGTTFSITLPAAGAAAPLPTSARAQ